jgi:hypothetical protein
MVIVLAVSVIDRWFEPGRVKPKTINLVYVVSPLSTQYVIVQVTVVRIFTNCVKKYLKE